MSREERRYCLFNVMGQEKSEDTDYSILCAKRRGKILSSMLCVKRIEKILIV